MEEVRSTLRRCSLAPRGQASTAHSGQRPLLPSPPDCPLLGRKQTLRRLRLLDRMRKGDSQFAASLRADSRSAGGNARQHSPKTPIRFVGTECYITRNCLILSGGVATDYTLDHKLAEIVVA
jgi:hypothetical protein